MRRPLAVIGFTCLGTLVAASYLGFYVNASLAVLFFVAAVVAFAAFRHAKGGRAAALLLVTAAAAAGLWCLKYQLVYQPCAALAGQQATVSGVVVDGPQHTTGGYYYYIIQADTVTLPGGQKGRAQKLRAGFSSPLTAKPYDRVAFRAKLALPYSGAGYDGVGYYHSKGIYLTAKPLADATVTPNPRPPLMYYAVTLRHVIHDRIVAAVEGQPGALAAGILIGDTSGLSGDISDAFRATGISHLLAVSGTQTSLIAQCLLLLFCALRLPRRAGSVLAMAGVTVFMAVTGFSPSVTRAGIMSLIFLLGILVGRQADALNSLGVAVLVLCLIDPFAATDVGLLLSFAATLGMILVSGRLLSLASRGAARFPRLPRPARRALLVPVGVLAETIGASLFSVPVIMLTFHNFSLVSPVSNLAQVPLSLVATILAALLAAAAPVRLLAVPLAFLLRLCCRVMIAAALGLASLPHALVSTDYGFVYIFLAFVLCAGAVWLLFRKKGGRLAVCAVCCAFVFVCGMFTFSVANRHVLEIDCLSVGQGSTTVLIRDGTAVVVGLSGYSPQKRVEDLLSRRNINKIAALVLPDYSRDAVDAANELMQKLPCALVLAPESYRAQGNEFLQFVSSPQQLLVWQGCPLTVVPDGAGGLAAVAQPGGGNVLLLPGKGQPTGGAATLRPGLVVFGGSVTAAGAKLLAPACAVAGGGSGALYTCPNFAAAGAKVYRSDEGMVCLRTRDGRQFQTRQES